MMAVATFVLGARRRAPVHIRSVGMSSSLIGGIVPERFALVTDVEWLKQRCRVFSFLLPARLRILPSTEAQIARAWIRRPLGPAIEIGGPNE